MEEGKIFEPKKVKVQRPFMKFLSSFCPQIGIALLVIGIAFLICINYDKNTIKNWDHKFWSYCEELVEEGLNVGSARTMSPVNNVNLDFMFFRFGDKTFKSKYTKYTQDDFADYVYNYYKDNLYIVPLIVSGALLIVVGYVTKVAYKTAQKEEENG